MNNLTVADHKKALSTLHIAMCIGVLFMTLVLYFAMPTQPKSFSAGLSGLGMVPLVVSALAMFAAFILFRKKTTHLGSLSDENVDEWRGAYIMKWAFLEGSALICFLIYFYAEPHPALLVVGLVMTLLLYIGKPSF